MSSKFKFLPEMDALRALAVLMTLGAHFLPEKGNYHVPFLWYGVDLFFVISGFLITSILLQTKVNSHTVPKFRIVKNFYIRRALRLFPIYYLFILFFFLAKHLFDIYLWKDEYNIYFFTYFQNWYFFKIGALNNHFSHLWSLGVEEQFYIIWPFILVFAPTRFFKYIFMGLILFSLILNTLFFEIPVFRNITFANFHTLGTGALLAYYYCIEAKQKIYLWVVKNRLWLNIATFAAFLFCKIVLKEKGAVVFVSEFLLAITAGFFVLNSVIGWPKVLHPITFNPIIQHIGKVSYGIYLFHLPIPALINVISTKYYLKDIMPVNPILKYLVMFTITYLIATISYELFEKRILKLKEKFD